MSGLSQREAWAVCLLIRSVFQHLEDEEDEWAFTCCDFTVGLDKEGRALLWNAIKKLEPKVR